MTMQSDQPKPISENPAQKPNEQGHILVQDVFCIRDKNTNEIIVKGRG